MISIIRSGLPKYFIRVIFHYFTITWITPSIIYLQDNPADYSFFFDTSRRRTCYVAPERFIDDSSTINTRPSLNETMDIFSLGYVCVCVCVCAVV